MTSNSSTQTGADAPVSSYIQSRSIELTTNMLEHLQRYERIALEMFGPVGSCNCHAANTCDRCCSTKQAHRMSKHVLAVWQGNLFQVHRDACKLEEDPAVADDIRSYLEYYIQHPGVTYRQWQEDKEVADILCQLRDRDLHVPAHTNIFGDNVSFFPPLAPRSAKTVHWAPDVQSGEWDDSMIALVPDDSDTEYLDLDPIAFYELSGEHEDQVMKSQWLDRLGQVYGGTAFDHYVAAKSVAMPHLRWDMLCYLQQQVEVEFRGSDTMDFQQLVDASRLFFAHRASELVVERLMQGDRSVIRDIEPQSGVEDTILQFNRWAKHHVARPGVLGLMQWTTNREFRVASSTLVDFVENLGMFAQDCSRAQSRTDYVFCVMRFIKQQFGISVLQTAHWWISSLVEEYVSALAEEVSSHNESAAPEAQAGFGEFLSAYQTVTRSNIWEKFAKLTMLLGTLAVGFFTGENITMDKFCDVCSSIYSGIKATEIVGQVLETIGAIYNKCIPVITGKEKFYTIFSGLGDGKQLDIDIAHFVTQATAYAGGTPAKDDDDPTALMVKGLIIIKKLEVILAKCHNGKERESVRRTLVSVTQAFNSLSLKHSNVGVREKPYSLSFFGGTSVGKTCMSMQVIVMLQRALGIPCGQQYIYRVDPDDDFMSCLSVLHNSYLMDDAGNTKPEHATVIISEPIIAIANNAPKAANMADLASKGVIPIRPSIFLATTNVKHLHAATYSVNPSAVLRRFECHITMAVKPEFAGENGLLADHVEPEKHGYNVWTFSVEKYLPPAVENNNQGLGRFEYRTDYEGNELRNVDFQTLCRFLVVDAKKHKERQDRFVTLTQNAHEQPYCGCGIPAVACTRCEIEQPVQQAGVLECVQYGRNIWDVCKNPYVMPYVQNQTYKMLLLWALEAWWFSYLLHSNYVLCLLIGTALVCCLHLYVRISVHQPGPIPTDQFARLVEGARSRVLGNREAIFTTLAAMATVYGAYKLAGSFANKPESQGSMPSRPVVIDVAKPPSPWIKPELTDVPKNSLTVTSTGKQLSDVLTAKLCVLFVYNGKDIHTAERGLFCVTFPVCTNFWIVPYHIISQDHEFVRVESKCDDKVNYCHSAFRADAYKRIGDTDYALLYMPNKGDQLDIRRFFPSKDDFPNGKVVLKDTPSRVSYIVREDKEVEGNVYKNPVRYASGVRVTSKEVTPRGIEAYWGGTYEFPVPTTTGICGSPIVSEGSGPFIVGMHSAGRTGTTEAYFNTVMREDLELCLQYMTADDTPMIQGASMGNLDIDYVNMPFEHVMHKKCDIQFMHRAEVDIMGSHTASTRRYTSKVEQTDYSDRVHDLLGLEQEHGKPALMNHWYPGRVWSEACSNPKPVELKYLTLAYNDLQEKIMQGLETIPNARDQIYVMEDIANTSGVDGKRGLYKMNYAASAGIPYGVPKSRFVRPSEFEFDGISVPVELTDDMKADVERMENDLKKGKRVYTPHRANRKDEAIKLGKAKVRIFSGTSMPYLFLMRKYFLSISVFMQEHPELFESAVGINCYSREWTRLYTYIVTFGHTRIIAGDYEKYDQYVANMMTYAAFKLLLIIARWAGFDDEDITVMIGLMTETCSPLYECDGSWMMFAGSTPSGHSLTVVINGLVNSMYARISFYVMRPDGSTYTFSAHVAFMSYGDDNIMSVDEQVPWYTHTTYQSALARYGLNYTMADKSGESVPYIDMEQATFLKRSWVYDPRYGRYKCPLDMKSISKMLHSMLVSGAVSKQQQLADILRSANQEFFMYDQPIFEKAHESLVQIAKEFDLCHFLPDCKLPGWQDLDVWYRDIA